MFVVVGVTGGIAAYKTVHLVRLLVQDGHAVHVVPTQDATRFVGIPTWEAISRNPVTTSVHDDVASVRHVALGQAADLVVVAPATANTLARMAAGIADDLLGTTLLATTAPVLVAPAMHSEMWQHPATQHNLRTLRSRGVRVVGPEDGPLTGGDSGPGRMSEPDAILEAAYAALGARRDLTGLRVVVSAGGTREPIDPVRYIGNRSSGKQGVAVAVAAAERGARVTLVAAHIEADVLAAAATRHPAIDVVTAGTAADLAAAVFSAAAGADIVVMAAAVADYRVSAVSEAKLTKESARQVPEPVVSVLEPVVPVPEPVVPVPEPVEGRTLELVETPDILAAVVAGRAPGQTIVGFAAETPAEGESLVERGRRKRARKGVDLLAVNAVGWTTGFERDDNELVIIDSGDDVVAEAAGTKREVADALWDAIVAVRNATAR
ncbi:MAG: bifunctional phosphopantothenoylcysteine decarboxylase/phosphopantothenate--cysteine ligase CoaBC [Microbacterium sp.]|uniref:bifunctional phosphopantothenoylcysteine decarboxylase/phosphopantothenate--cysteine ligase CoaBC n=1 Tax=Microbacterium sp. TaxID=51671 RepID=UPI0039E2A006